MPRHPGASGDGSVAGHIRVELHVHPNLLLRFGELARRSDAPHLVPQGLPLRLHLLNERVQLLLALLPSFRLDIFRMALAVRPGGGVAALKQVVVDLCDTPCTSPPDLSPNGLVVCHLGWPQLRGVLLHLVAQPTFNFSCSLGLHIPVTWV